MLFFRRSLLGFLSLGLALFCLPSAVSAALMSYEFRVSENLNVLTNPNSISAQQKAVQTTVQALILARDMPYFQLLNTSLDPQATLTSMRLELPASRPYDFDFVSWISASPGVSYILNQPDLVNNGLHSKFIDITFTGLTTGKSVIFRADIDNTTGDPNFQTDYRNVLFSANSSDPTTNNALLTVGYNNNNTELTDSRNMPNFTTNGTVYSCICFRNPAQVDHVMAFSMVQDMTEQLVIPEPGAFAGFILMLGGACWWWRRVMQLTRQE